MQESDASAISESAKSAARERYTQALETLSAEMKEQVSAHQATRRRLAIEKEHWFGECLIQAVHILACMQRDKLTFATVVMRIGPIPKRGLVVSQMLQHCIHPRALLSPTDAMFAAKFLRLMHSSGTRNFSSITAYDKVSLAAR